MANVPALIDLHGRPLQRRDQAQPAGRRARASVPGGAVSPGYSQFPYEASELQTQEMGDWLPWIRSPDAEINQFRDRMVARSRDLARNDGWAAGGVTRILDNTVGASLRLSVGADYRALATYSGANFDPVWADEYRQAVEARWRIFSSDIGRYNDVGRRLTVSQQLRLALRHKLVDGDALAVVYWLERRMGPGAAHYATAFKLVDPDRLSNPQQQMDTATLRGGVELDEDEAPVAYHIRKAHQNDWYNAVESMEWERVERQDADGWIRVVHDFEQDRAGQNRGLGIFTTVISRLKMLGKYYGVELQAATIASMLGTYVTSPYDPEMVGDALSDGDDELSRYQSLRADWAEERPAMFNGARVPTLAPGEEINTVSAAHPHDAFEGFAKEMLRSVASAIGISAEQLSQDWSKTNYSSARAALLESWKTLVRRRDEFATGFATPLYSCWLHEAFDRDELPLPTGAPDFLEMRTAYSRCSWLGPGRGWVDPVKEKAGAILGMDAGLSTLKYESAEQGRDWEEDIDQRAIELAKFAEKGIAPPSWAGAMAAQNDTATFAGPTQEPDAG